MQYKIINLLWINRVRGDFLAGYFGDVRVLCIPLQSGHTCTGSYRNVTKSTLLSHEDQVVAILMYLPNCEKTAFTYGRD